MARFYTLEEEPLDSFEDYVAYVGKVGTEDYDRRRIIGQNEVGAYLVSTVFLTVNHAIDEDDPPLLYETAIFINNDNYGEDDNWNEIKERYSTRSAAEAGHVRWLAWAKTDLNGNKNWDVT